MSDGPEAAEALLAEDAETPPEVMKLSNLRMKFELSKIFLFFAALFHFLETRQDVNKRRKD